MNTCNPLVTVCFEGSAIGTGTIPVSHLLRFLTNLEKALFRTGRVLAGESESLRRGPQPRNIKSEVSLDLVLLTHRSPSAVLGFERRGKQQAIPNMDFGLDILEKAVVGLSTVQKPDRSLPCGYNADVLMAWRDVGTLFKRGVEKIEFTLNHRETHVSSTYTPQGFTRIQERIKGPQINIRTIEGRLLMADFKEHGTRCRVHPSVGDPVLCLFNDEQKEEVLEDILQYVRIVGEAQEDPVSGKITSIRIHDIERLEEKKDEAVDLLPQGTPISPDFWKSPVIEDLAVSQNVKPVTDVHALFGTWPGEIGDGFEEAIEELRHQQMSEGTTS